MHKIEGNHNSMLNSKKIAAIINDEPLEDKEIFKENLKFSSEL